jgi:hypothetical protein
VERVLLEQGKECFEQAGPSLIEILSDPHQCTELLIVSDGGTAIEYGTFGFGVATLDRVIWKCKGPLFGHLVHSFRAESTGVIAGIWWFLRRFTHQFFGIKPVGSPQLWFGMDSQSLLNRIKELKQYKILEEWWPTIYTWSDIDITQEIFMALEDEEYPFSFVFNHAKAHQDDNT